MAFLEADLCKKIISVTQPLKLNPEKPNKREYTVIPGGRILSTSLEIPRNLQKLF